MSAERPPLVIYGASGHSSGGASHQAVVFASGPLYRVVASIDDFRGERGEFCEGAPILSFERWRETWRGVGANHSHVRQADSGHVDSTTACQLPAPGDAEPRFQAFMAPKIR